MTLPTPPRYVVLPHEVIEQAYKGEKPKRALLASFTRILSLAWEAKYQKTPALNETELMTFLKLSRRQYFEQKAEMEADGWLRSSHPRTGFVQFDFSRHISEAGSAENRTGSAENRTSVLRIEEEDSEFNLIKSSSSIHPEKEQVRKTALQAAEVRKSAPADGSKIRALIENLPLLFDADLYGVLEMRAEWESLPEAYALGWITKAYQERESLNQGGRALGLIAARLNKGEAPNRHYISRYQDVLTERYLEAVGLIEFECAFCNATFETREALEAHERESHPYVCEDCRPAVAFASQADWRAHYDAIHNPYVAKQAESSLPSPDRELGQAWASVKTALQENMPRASFDTWVRDTQPVRYDGNVLQVGARNAYARDWLSSRLTEKSSTLAAKVFSQTVRVEFVVADMEAA